MKQRQDKLENDIREHDGRISDLTDRTASCEDVVEDIKSTLSEHENNITTIKQHCDSRFESVMADVRAQGDQIRELENNRMVNWPLVSENQNEQTAGTSDKSQTNQPGILNEVNRTVNECIERQRNIIIFNAPESNSNLRDQVSMHDNDYVRSICQYLSGEDQRFTQKRLGKRVKFDSVQSGRGNDAGSRDNVSGGDAEQTDQGSPGSGSDASASVAEAPIYRPRPLMVQFADIDSKAKIMKKLFRLSLDEVPDEIKNINVKHDMTPEEREIDKKLRQQAREMNSAKEDLNSKYKVTGPPWERKITKVAVPNRSRDRVKPQAQETVKGNH